MGDDKKLSEHINLKVLGQDNAIIQFKIKKHTPLRKLMVAYCERANLSKESVRFRFDGAPVNEMDTPETLEMEEGDTIEVYQPQTGGSISRHNYFCRNGVSRSCSQYYSHNFLHCKAYRYRFFTVKRPNSMPS